jgi:hypothetical protein
MSKPETATETETVEKTVVVPSKRQVYATLAGLGVTIATGVVAQVLTAKITNAIMEKTEKPKTEN